MANHTGQLLILLGFLRLKILCLPNFKINLKNSLFSFCSKGVFFEQKKETKSGLISLIHWSFHRPLST